MRLIKGTLSEKKQLATGVPQGSCLGPVLFTIYVADFFQIIEKHLPEAQGYTDDHQVYCHWKLCGRTEELNDFQHAYGEWQQDRILDCRK